jgi:hypothetical protein
VAAAFCVSGQGCPILFDDAELFEKPVDTAAQLIENIQRNISASASA